MATWTVHKWENVCIHVWVRPYVCLLGRTHILFSFEVWKHLEGNLCKLPTVFSDIKCCTDTEAACIIQRLTAYDSCLMQVKCSWLHRFLIFNTLQEVFAGQAGLHHRSKNEMSWLSPQCHCNHDIETKY